MVEVYFIFGGSLFSFDIVRIKFLRKKGSSWTKIFGMIFTKVLSKWK